MCKKYIRFKINSDIIYYLSHVNKKNILLQHIWEILIFEKMIPLSYYFYSFLKKISVIKKQFQIHK